MCGPASSSLLQLYCSITIWQCVHCQFRWLIYTSHSTKYALYCKIRTHNLNPHILFTFTFIFIFTFTHFHFTFTSRSLLLSYSLLSATACVLYFHPPNSDSLVHLRYSSTQAARKTTLTIQPPEASSYPLQKAAAAVSVSPLLAGFLFSVTLHAAVSYRCPLFCKNAVEPRLLH